MEKAWPYVIWHPDTPLQRNTFLKYLKLNVKYYLCILTESKDKAALAWEMAKDRFRVSLSDFLFK